MDTHADASIIENKIVLVGVTAESVKDEFFTPFSGSSRVHGELATTPPRAADRARRSATPSDRREHQRAAFRSFR